VLTVGVGAAPNQRTGARLTQGRCGAVTVWSCCPNVLLLGYVCLAESTRMKHGGQNFARVWLMGKLDGMMNKGEYIFYTLDAHIVKLVR
jgi:hypothetical protein